MRITIVTGPFYSLPPAPCGAVEFIWHGLARRFVAAGHEVNCVCRAYPGLASDETVDGIRYIRRTEWTRSGRIGVSLAKDMAYSMQILPHLPQADILTTNVFWLPAFVRRLRRGVGRLIVNVHRFPKKQLRLYGGADRLATCSSVIMAAIGEQAPELLGRTRVFKNPVDVSVFSPPLEARRRQLTRTVLYTGRIHPEKGLHLLVEGFARLHRQMPDTRLRIVGPWKIGQGGGGPDFIRLLRSLCGGAPVEIDEPIFDRAGLAKVYRSADCYCYPSIAETGESFGCAPLEAMATGLAPVVSDLTCFREYLRDGVNGFVFDHRALDPAEQLCQALCAVLSDGRRAEEMGQAGVRTAAEYSYEKVAISYLEDFEQLSRRPPNAGGTGAESAVEA